MDDITGVTTRISVAYELRQLHGILTGRPFSTLNSNVDRVEFVRQLWCSRFSPDILLHAGKNTERSKSIREEGNVFFNNRKFFDAIQRYTESISYAPPGSEALGMAFANRSAVFMHLKMYKECLQDIVHALDNNYPKTLHQKIINRRENAQKGLANEKTTTSNMKMEYGKPPSLSFNPHPKIKHAGDCIKIQNTTQWGNHVVATKNISFGDVIALENPFSMILTKEKYRTHCYECLKPCVNLISCNKCTLVMYCGNACKIASWTSHHVFECPILSMLFLLQFNECTMALKICLTISRETADKMLTDGFVCQRLKNSYYNPRAYKKEYQFDNVEDKHPDIFEKSVMTAIIFELVLKNTTFFYDAWKKDEQYQDLFKELLLHNLLRMASNNFYLINETVKIPEKVKAEIKGFGAYSFLRKINHSCSPNVMSSFYGNCIALRALRPIKTGEQLFDCYRLPYYMIPKRARQEFLLRRYKFLCKCDACTYDWPLYEDLPVKYRDIGIDADTRWKLEIGCPETAANVLTKLKTLGHLFDQSKPYKEMITAQVMLRKCDNIMGSRQDFSMLFRK